MALTGLNGQSVVITKDIFDQHQEIEPVAVIEYERDEKPRPNAQNVFITDVWHDEQSSSTKINGDASETRKNLKDIVEDDIVQKSDGLDVKNREDTHLSSPEIIFSMGEAESIQSEKEKTLQSPRIISELAVAHQADYNDNTSTQPCTENRSEPNNIICQEETKSHDISSKAKSMIEIPSVTRPDKDCDTGSIEDVKSQPIQGDWISVEGKETGKLESNQASITKDFIGTPAAELCPVETTNMTQFTIIKPSFVDEEESMPIEKSSFISLTAAEPLNENSTLEKIIETEALRQYKAVSDADLLPTNYPDVVKPITPINRNSGNENSEEYLPLLTEPTESGLINLLEAPDEYKAETTSIFQSDTDNLAATPVGTEPLTSQASFSISTPVEEVKNPYSNSIDLNSTQGNEDFVSSSLTETSISPNFVENTYNKKTTLDEKSSEYTGALAANLVTLNSADMVAKESDQDVVTPMNKLIIEQKELNIDFQNNNNLPELVIENNPIGVASQPTQFDTVDSINDVKNYVNNSESSVFLLPEDKSHKIENSHENSENAKVKSHAVENSSEISKENFSSGSYSNACSDKFSTVSLVTNEIRDEKATEELVTIIAVPVLNSEETILVHETGEDLYTDDLDAGDSSVRNTGNINSQENYLDTEIKELSIQARDASVDQDILDIKSSPIQHDHEISDETFNQAEDHYHNNEDNSENKDAKTLKILPDFSSGEMQVDDEIQDLMKVKSNENIKLCATSKKNNSLQTESTVSESDLNSTSRIREPQLISKTIKISEPEEIPKPIELPNPEENTIVETVVDVQTSDILDAVPMLGSQLHEGPRNDRCVESTNSDKQLIENTSSTQFGVSETIKETNHSIWNPRLIYCTIKNGELEETPEPQELQKAAEPTPAEVAVETHPPKVPNIAPILTSNLVHKEPRGEENATKKTPTIESDGLNRAHNLNSLSPKFKHFPVVKQALAPELITISNETLNHLNRRIDSMQTEIDRLALAVAVASQNPASPLSNDTTNSCFQTENLATEIDNQDHNLALGNIPLSSGTCEQTKTRRHTKRNSVWKALWPFGNSESEADNTLGFEEDVNTRHSVSSENKGKGKEAISSPVEGKNPKLIGKVGGKYHVHNQFD